MAGTAQMTTAVWLNDGATGKDLGMFVVEIETGTTSGAVGATAKAIARVIIEAYKKP
jgi:hypothetical protein